MKNTVDGFFQTLVAGVTEASKLLAPTWATSRAIYWDYRADETGTIGKTLNVNIPVDPTSNVTDIGTGDINVSEFAFSTVPIVFAYHPQYGYPVRDFEQFNSPQQIRTVFADASMKAIKNHVNKQITDLFTTSNFTTNTAIETTSGIVTVPQFLSGMANLDDQYAPVSEDPENMSFITNSKPYYNMMDGTVGSGGAAWNQALIAGNRIAESVRRDGKMPYAYNCAIMMDQQLPTSGTAPSRTWTNVLLHRWAVAGVSRPLPPPDANVVNFSYVDFGGVSIRVSVGYDIKMSAYIVSLDAGYGLKVVRENLCQLFTTAE